MEPSDEPHFCVQPQAGATVKQDVQKRLAKLKERESKCHTLDAQLQQRKQMIDAKEEELRKNKEIYEQNCKLSETSLATAASQQAAREHELGVREEAMQKKLADMELTVHRRGEQLDTRERELEEYSTDLDREEASIWEGNEDLDERVANRDRQLSIERREFEKLQRSFNNEVEAREDEVRRRERRVRLVEHRREFKSLELNVTNTISRLANMTPPSSDIVVEQVKGLETTMTNSLSTIATTEQVKSAETNLTNSINGLANMTPPSSDIVVEQVKGLETTMTNSLTAKATTEQVESAQANIINAMVERIDRLEAVINKPRSEIIDLEGGDPTPEQSNNKRKRQATDTDSVTFNAKRIRAWIDERPASNVESITSWARLHFFNPATDQNVPFDTALREALQSNDKAITRFLKWTKSPIERTTWNCLMAIVEQDDPIVVGRPSNCRSHPHSSCIGIRNHAIKTITGSTFNYTQ